MICSGSHSSAEMELALTSGPHILRLGALWPLGSICFGDVDSGRCRTGPVCPSQPRQGHDSWNVHCGWYGLAANGRRPLWSTLTLLDVYSPSMWRLTFKVLEKCSSAAKQRWPTHMRSLHNVPLQFLNVWTLNFSTLINYIEGLIETNCNKQGFFFLTEDLCVLRNRRSF